MREQLSYRSTNVEDGACLDVVAEEFWDHRQKAYFDVKVFNPLAHHLLTVLLHSLSVIDGQSLRKDECMKNVFGRERAWQFHTLSLLMFWRYGTFGNHCVLQPLATIVSCKSDQFPRSLARLTV